MFPICNLTNPYIYGPFIDAKRAKFTDMGWGREFHSLTTQRKNRYEYHEYIIVAYIT